MLLKVLLASGALVFVGILAMRATGADREKPSQDGCGMRMPDRSAAPAKDARNAACPMIAQSVDNDSRPMAAKPTSRRAVTKTTYTCPMHPDVTSDKPGKCPKCGMRLVAKQDKPKNDKKPADNGDSGPGHSDHVHDQ